MAGLDCFVVRATGAVATSVGFTAPDLATPRTVSGRYRQLTRKRSSQQRGGEDRARGLRPLYLVQPTFTLSAATKSHDRIVPISVTSRPGAQWPQPLQTRLSPCVVLPSTDLLPFSLSSACASADWAAASSSPVSLGSLSYVLTGSRADKWTSLQHRLDRRSSSQAADQERVDPEGVGM